MKFELEIVKFNVADVITTSGGAGGNTGSNDCDDPIFA